MDYAVILAGGYGQRFWPLSRMNKPKQCLPIVSDKPMIKDTIDRLSVVFGENIYISTGRDMSDEIKKIMPDSKFIIEPMARNTAACIGLSAMTLFSRDPDSVMFIETADHYYKDVELYLSHVRFALSKAKETDKIILIGIHPSSIHTGYGYIEKDSIVDSNSIDLCGVKSFKEKPSYDIAKEYVESGKFLWNSGMFISKCSVMLAEIEKNLPELYASICRIRDSNFDESVLNFEFEKLEKISIDVGVMEKSSEVLVVDAQMHWDDVGDFNAYERILTPDSDGNFVKSDIVSVNSTGNIVVGNKLVSLIGVKDLIVITTDDVVLVCDKNCSQDIKKVIEILNEKKKINFQ
ncbi:mannose-1-phosphate guanylyltransferase [Candidatus Woesearchaeota archaeon]|nr:mannose-1-phosphate guanylyltransferase [Candidatus Woesearchaeota archaeon]